jgi:hypothetical protein
MSRITALLVALLIGAATARAQDDFKPLFNGKDLAGWHNVNCAPGTFFVKDNMIITTGKPTGYLRTDRHYENFIAEFDWMHIPPKKGEVGNSGFFVWADPIPALGTGYTRGIEVQVLVNLEWTDKTELESALKRAKDPEEKMRIQELLAKKSGKSTATSHGDLFSIHGATCEPDRPHPLGWKRSIPSENRAKGENEWNHYRVEANDGVIKLAVNGKFVSTVSKCKPRKGYLALESEGSECRFKNLKIKELPTTNPKADEVCDVDKGWKCLFTGLDLTGWKAGDEHKGHWKMNDGVLSCDGKSKDLQTQEPFGDFELVCDWRGGKSGIAIRGNAQVVPLAADKGWSRAIIRARGDRLSVSVNGKTVIDEAKISGAASGPIALRDEGNAVAFRNVFVRDLKSEK